MKHTHIIIALSLTCLLFLGCSKDKEQTKSSAKEINSFAINETQGVISEENKTINLILPSETDLTSLAPVITISEKASINPKSESIQDFSSPITYTVTAEDGSTSSYTIMLTLSPNNADWVNLTVTSEDIRKGATAPNGTISVAAGSTQNLVVHVYPGYEFRGWYINNIKWSESNPYDIIVNGDLTIVARFNDLPRYTVDLQSEDTNKGTVSGGGSGGSGITVKISATPKVGYVFEGWYKGNVKIPGLEANADYMPTENCTLIAKFTPITYYNVNVQSEDENKGTVAGGGSGGSGVPVSISATPNSRYEFEGWYKNNIKIAELGASASYTPTENCTLIAKFKRLPVTVKLKYDYTTNKGTASIVGSGLRDQAIVEVGNSILINATPAYGCEFDAWYINNIRQPSIPQNGYYFPTDNVTLEARFNQVAENTIKIVAKNMSPSGYFAIEYCLFPTAHNGVLAGHSGVVGPESVYVYTEMSPQIIIKIKTVDGIGSSQIYVRIDGERIAWKNTRKVGDSLTYDMYIDSGYSLVEIICGP